MLNSHTYPPPPSYERADGQLNGGMELLMMELQHRHQSQQQQHHPNQHLLQALQQQQGNPPVQLHFHQQTHNHLQVNMIPSSVGQGTAFPASYQQQLTNPAIMGSMTNGGMLTHLAATPTPNPNPSHTNGIQLYNDDEASRQEHIRCEFIEYIQDQGAGQGADPTDYMSHFIEHYLDRHQHSQQQHQIVGENMERLRKWLRNILEVFIRQLTDGYQRKVGGQGGSVER